MTRSQASQLVFEWHGLLLQRINRAGAAMNSFAARYDSARGLNFRHTFSGVNSTQMLC